MRRTIAIVIGVVLSQGVVGCAGSAGPGVDGSGDTTGAPAASSSAGSGDGASASSASGTFGGSIDVAGPSGGSPSSSSSTPSTCAALSAGATAYVDHASGIDDPAHGGADGACAFRTLTYALSHASGTIALAAGDYPSLGETLPFELHGRQALQCNPAVPATLRFDASAMPSRGGSPLATVVRFAGDANAISGCAIDGAAREDVVCVEIASTAAKGAQHAVTSSTLSACWGVGVEIGDHVKGAVVRGNGFYGADLAIAIGRGTNASIESNAFHATRSADIYCMDNAPNAVTGSGNGDGAGGAPVCVDCASCPLL